MLMAVSIMASGSRDRDMGKGFLHIEAEITMKGSSLMVNDMDTEYSRLKTKACMRVNGLMIK